MEPTAFSQSAAGPMMPPVVEVIPQRLFVSLPFAVLVRVGSEWRKQNKLVGEDIWSAGLRAELLLEGTRYDNAVPLGPCARCCKSKQSSIRLGLSDMKLFGPRIEDPSAPFLELYNFDHCRSYCNSSRLHYGGKVVLKLDLVRSVDGAAVGTIMSEPFDMCSKVPHKLSKEKKKQSQKRKSSPQEGALQSPQEGDESSGDSPAERTANSMSPQRKREPQPSPLSQLQPAPQLSSPGDSVAPGTWPLGAVPTPIFTSPIPTIPFCTPCGDVMAQYQMMCMQPLQLDHTGLLLRQQQEHRALVMQQGSAPATGSPASACTVPATSLMWPQQCNAAPMAGPPVLNS